jgi:hypothetical protein
MPQSKVPYINAYGRIHTTLEKIQTASTPPRFTQDFLATKLGVKGGSAKPVIPFLKRTGFLGSDGVPTELYKRFRNETQRGAAAAEALRIGYAPLYEINEYVHDAKDSELKGVVVQATGLEDSSSTVRAIIGSFKALLEFADFEAPSRPSPIDLAEETMGTEAARSSDGTQGYSSSDVRTISLGYTINLQLPATSDIAVFDAIFKSLREHLVQD